MVENTVVLRLPRKGRTCVFDHVMGCLGGWWLGIRICFPNRVYILVGDTAMFSEPGIYFGWGYGHVFATYGWRSWGVCCCAPTRVTCHTSKYGHVFRTGYIFRLGIRPCFRHQWVALVGRMLLHPYTCYMPYIEIRTCYSNREYVLVRNTAMFFEPGTNDPSKFERVFRTGHT